MNLVTRNFGEITIEAKNIIKFEEGLPGFPLCKQFTLIEELTDVDDNDKETLIYWLQSVEETDVAFVLMDVFSIMPDYNPLIESEEIAELGEYNEEDFDVYNICVVPEDVSQLTVNLKAPIVINTVSKLGKQVIVTNEEYGIKHLIFEEIKAKKLENRETVV